MSDSNLSWLRAGVIPNLVRPGEVPAAWKKKISKMAGLMRNAACVAEFAPFRDEGIQLFIHAMENVAKQAGGECGAITGVNLQAGCIMMAHARYWSFKAQERPEDRQLALSYASLMNTARATLNAAYELEVKLARDKPRTAGDPLAAFDVPPEPEDK